MAKNTDISYRNQLLYSVFVRDYGKNGTFKDVEDDLDRIRSLGTDIIWFMPIQEIHRRGMRCIIDVVYNHTSPDSVLSREHPEWFYRDENGRPKAIVAEWWDIVDLDYKNPGLWDYLVKTLCYWAQYVDGFRCDVASFIPLDFWKMAREAVEEVRPDAFWLAESVETDFIQRIRGNGEYCYDYDIFNELSRYLLGKGPLGRYLDRLNLQECIYPENYIKLHFTENHDRIRTAALVPDLRNRRHLLAFTMFQKGISFIYNGQERSAAAFANIFEKEPIDWTGPDLSDVIVKMKKLKETEIFAAGTFFADEVRDGVVRAVYTHGKEKLVGLFAIGSGVVGADTGLPDGPYRDLYSGEDIYIYHGAVPVGEDPVIIGSL